MRHFPHHIGDYAAHTAHLTFVEDAAYHRLLRRYYQDEKPLPADLAAVQRLVGARAKEERAAVETVLREFFTLQDDGWHQARADQEIVAYQNRADAGRTNGALGGRPKGKNNRTKTGQETGSEPDNNHNQEPVTKNQEPIPVTTTESVANSAPAGASQPRAKLITEDWEPSETDLTGLRRERPDLVGELYDSRMRDFRDWCSAQATRTFNPAATWRGFMRKTKTGQVAGESFDQRRIREGLKAIGAA